MSIFENEHTSEKGEFSNTNLMTSYSHVLDIYLFQMS